jgi:hypothetical protein
MKVEENEASKSKHFMEPSFLELRHERKSCLLHVRFGHVDEPHENWMHNAIECNSVCVRLTTLCIYFTVAVHMVCL